MKTKKKKTKKNIELAFYEKKWFKLICLFSLFGWLFYMGWDSFQINKNELIEIKVTVSEKWKSGGRKDPVKIYFKSKQYPSRFGIYVGGTFGRWTEVRNALKQNSGLTIRIHKSNKKNLNIAAEVIPIYFLNNDNLGLIFDEDDFNRDEKKSDNRWRGFLIIVFLVCGWSIIRD